MNNNTIILNENPEPIVLEVVMIPKTKFQYKLMQWDLMPQKRLLNIFPLTIGTTAKISKLLLSIDKNLLSSEAALSNAIETIATHKDTICKIIAIAVKNDKGKFSRSCKRLVHDQFTIPELTQALLIVIQQMNAPIFMNCICLMRGIDLNKQSQ